MSKEEYEIWYNKHLAMLAEFHKYKEKLLKGN
jgi:hypothetical protein